MKLKYYLRGLGIGILVTGLIMGISQKHAVAEAKAELMRAYSQNVLEGDLAEETTTEESSMEAVTEPILIREDETESATIPVIDWAMLNEQNVTDESVTDTSEPENSEPESSVSEQSAVEEESEAVVIIKSSEEDSSDENMVTIVILKGDDSGTVSRKLYNAGLIENASEYDAFLMQHGYDKRINPGTKLIAPDASWQEIAEKITR